MKRTKKYLLIGLFSLFALTACSKDSDKDNQISQEEIDRVEGYFLDIKEYIEETGPMNISLKDFEHIDHTVKGHKLDIDKEYHYKLADGDLYIKTKRITPDESIIDIKLKNHKGDDKYEVNIEAEQREKISKETGN